MITPVMHPAIDRQSVPQFASNSFSLPVLHGVPSSSNLQSHPRSSTSSSTLVNRAHPDARGADERSNAPFSDYVNMRLSRDDTPADHSVASSSSTACSLQSGISNDEMCCFSACDPSPAWVDDGPPVPVRDSRRQQRRPSLRMYSSPSLPTLSESSASAPSKATGSIGRRISKTYKEGFIDGFKDIKARIRRSSNPQPSAHFPSVLRSITSAGAVGSPAPPTSPSKRNGRYGDDRPKKIRSLLHGSDRKDTPAPPLASNRERPASRQLSSAVVPPNGGDRARQSAAAWKYTTPPAQDSVWPPQQEFDVRRQRQGSFSSAADSGADLSTYAGSVKDAEGDVEMTMDTYREPEQRAHDFVKLLPSEISLQIFEHLDGSDLLQAGMVSMDWNEMTNHTSVWRTAFLREYQRRIHTNPPPVQVGGAGCGLPNRPDQEWKRMFKARKQLDANWKKGPKDAGKAIYLSGHTDSVYCVQFDEEKIITGSRDRTIRVWDINNFTCKMVIGGPSVRPVPGPKVLRTVDYPDFHIATASVNGTPYGDGIFKIPTQWHDASILCLQYDEKILVTGSSDCDLLVWDIETYNPICRLRKHTGGVLDVALDAKHIVSCSKDSRIIVWDRENYEAKAELVGHRGPVNAVQLRGKFLASASGDGIARLWDLEQMKLVKEFSAKDRGLAAVEFSEDMQSVLAGGNDTITYRFDTATGREVQQYTGHTQLVRSLWLDGQNNRVVTGSYDLDLRVYDLQTGSQIWRAEEWTTSWMLAAKSDYRRIVATSQDGRILIIDFGLFKGIDIRDGQPFPDIELLRGLERTSAINFIDPWQRDRENLGIGGDTDASITNPNRQSSVAGGGEAPALSFW